MTRALPAVEPAHAAADSCRRARWVRVAAIVVLAATGAFLAVGAAFDLLTDAMGRLPSDHAATFAALTGTTWQQAVSTPGYSPAYVIRAEAGYAAFELLFGMLFLIVVVVPLRHGERWAWWSAWLVLGAFSAFGVIFGAYDSSNLRAAIVAATMAVVALLALHFQSATYAVIAPKSPTQQEVLE